MELGVFIIFLPLALNAVRVLGLIGLSHLSEFVKRLTSDLESGFLIEWRPFFFSVSGRNASISKRASVLVKVMFTILDTLASFERSKISLLSISQILGVLALQALGAHLGGVGVLGVTASRERLRP